jgi:hypothetical protein
VDQWLILVHVIPADGEVSSGDDPYAAIDLPGGVAPVEFGAPMAVPEQDGPGSSLRCGEIEPDDAARLASSLFDSPTNGAFVLTPDASARIKVVAEPIFVPNYGCAELAADLAPPAIKGVELPPVTGLLAGIDPCGFVSDKAMGYVEADTRSGRAALQPFGLPARSCVVSDSGTASELATVSLYPDRAVGDMLEQALAAAFGQRPPTEDIGSQSVFHQDNLFAINNREEFVTVEFTAAADPTTQRAFVSAVATQVH